MAEAANSFDELVDRVSVEGIVVELERENVVVARLVPVAHRLLVRDLNGVFAGLPPLGEDSDSFARDLEQIRREVPRETTAWD